MRWMPSPPCWNQRITELFGRAVKEDAGCDVTRRARGHRPGFSRSYSHSLFGQAITGPALRISRRDRDSRNPDNFSGIGLCAEVNLHFG